MMRKRCKFCVANNTLLTDHRGYPYLGPKTQPISTKRMIMSDKNRNEKWTELEFAERKGNYDTEMVPYFTNIKIIQAEFPALDFTVIPERLKQRK